MPILVVLLIMVVVALACAAVTRWLGPYIGGQWVRFINGAMIVIVAIWLVLMIAQWLGVADFPSLTLPGRR